MNVQSNESPTRSVNEVPPAKFHYEIMNVKSANQQRDRFIQIDILLKSSSGKVFIETWQQPLGRHPWLVACSPSVFEQVHEQQSKGQKLHHCKNAFSCHYWSSQWWYLGLFSTLLGLFVLLLLLDRVDLLLTFSSTGFRVHFSLCLDSFKRGTNNGTLRFNYSINWSNVSNLTEMII